MADDFDWMFRCAYDISRILATERDALIDDLYSGDEDTRKKAEAGLGEILGWLRPPSEHVPREELRVGFEKALNATDLSVAQRRRVALIASRSTGERGRLRTHGPSAMCAFTLHLTTPKSWREIAFEINGPCEHICVECRDVRRPPQQAQSGLRPRRPKARCPNCGHTIRPDSQRQRVCYRCADALRESVGQSEKFLRAEGWYPSLPRRKLLDSLLPGEIERL